MAPPRNTEVPQSDVPGVSYVKNTGRWVVQFCRQGKHYSLFCATQDEAEEAQPDFLASLPPKSTRRKVSR